MTEDNGKKLTLSGTSTLTLKKSNLNSRSEGKKIVQVEVRKKRFVSQFNSVLILYNYGRKEDYKEGRCSC